MVAVKNNEAKELELPFEGDTYVFPASTLVLVPEKVAEHMKTVWPLAFEYNVEVKKSQTVVRARSYKTKSLYPKNEETAIDMKVSRGKMEAEMLSPDQETQGPGFYGPGVEVDNPNE